MPEGSLAGGGAYIPQSEKYCSAVKIPVCTYCTVLCIFTYFYSNSARSHVQGYGKTSCIFLAHVPPHTHTRLYTDSLPHAHAHMFTLFYNTCFGNAIVWNNHILHFIYNIRAHSLIMPNHVESIMAICAGAQTTTVALRYIHPNLHTECAHAFSMCRGAQQVPQCVMSAPHIISECMSICVPSHAVWDTLATVKLYHRTLHVAHASSC